MSYMIGEICGDHDSAVHCNHIMLQGTKIADAYSVEGLDTHDELAKK